MGVTYNADVVPQREFSYGEDLGDRDDDITDQEYLHFPVSRKVSNRFDAWALSLQRQLVPSSDSCPLPFRLEEEECRHDNGDRREDDGAQVA